MGAEDTIRLFGLANPAIERELDKVETEFKIDLQRALHDQKDEDYYPQFDQAFRMEAAEMGQHYEMFYCLEKSIRKLVAETLELHGEKWWDTHVPKQVKENAEANIKKERDSGVSLRSVEELDYTTFGELGEIVRQNWSDFGATFSSEKAFTKIMTSLNQLRAPIAHCCPLKEDEVVRLRLTVRDWFRLME